MLNMQVVPGLHIVDALAQLPQKLELPLAATLFGQIDFREPSMYYSSKV
jgi:hypothetical protein